MKYPTLTLCKGCRVKTLTKEELLRAVVSGVDVSCVWSKELQSLLKERDALKAEAVMLRLENETLKGRLNAVTDFTFVRLYA